MYSYFAWIVLSSADDTIEAEREFAQDLERLRSLVADRLCLNGREAIFSVNHMALFQCAEQHNHMRDHHARLLEVLVWISEKMPGSHGVIYWQDDGLPDHAEANRYHVIVLRKGTIENQRDTFLSPCEPMIEWEIGADGRAIS